MLKNVIYSLIFLKNNGNAMFEKLKRGQCGKSYLIIFAAIVIFSLFGETALADHSLGQTCTTCHRLLSAQVVGTSKKHIVCSKVEDPMYGWEWNDASKTCETNTTNTFWYCGSGKWTPDVEPLDCSYCHDTAGDIGNEILDATGLSSSGSASFHPVDVSGTNQNIGLIYCNDCHNSDVTPADKCSNEPDDAYPNHFFPAARSTDPTGANLRTYEYTHLSGKYGDFDDNATYGSDWSSSLLGINAPVCFNCHKSGGVASTDIESDYACSPNGGHNIVAFGDLPNKKLPCYDCHDPHASNDNLKLIISSGDVPNNPYKKSFNTGVAPYNYPPPIGFNGTNDYVVCVACHDNGRTVEGVVIDDVILLNGSVDVFTPIFPFHANAHSEVGATTTCLQNNSGCHKNVHNLDPFPCLDCHSKAVTDAMATPPAKLLAVNHVDSEFAHIGAVGPGDSDANYIASVHSIPYDDGACDMTLTTNNGCLFCHNTVGGLPNEILRDADGGTYSRPAAAADWTAFSAYDKFCLSCHDGDASIKFAPPTDYDLHNGIEGSGGGIINYTYTLSDFLYPPQVNSKASQTEGHFFDSGHGRKTDYPSGNPAGAVPCLQCHLYHGSTSPKLLPGWRPSKDLEAKVIKEDGGVTSGSRWPLAGAGKPDSTKIDYLDYTASQNNSRLTAAFNLQSRYVSEYTEKWNTYSNDAWSNNVPAGTEVPFGTSGDMRANLNSLNELNCGSDADAPPAIGKFGFCNACHFSDATQSPTPTVLGTSHWVYTHEGEYGGEGGDTEGACTGSPLLSDKNFFKDCAECHDPHGSGQGGATGASNLYMIRGKIKHGVAPSDSINWSEVVFTSEGGTAVENDNSHDENDAGPAESNADDVCAACHEADTAPGDPNDVGVDHNYRGYTGAPDHAQGHDCTLCHTHGWNKPKTNRQWVGFNKNIVGGPGPGPGTSGSCTNCHGDKATGRIWPDGIPNIPIYAYADDSVGAHDNHIAAIGKYLGYGDYAVSMYSGEDQVAICAFCHPNPGEGNHVVNETIVDRVDLYQDSDDATTQLDVFRKFTGSAAYALDLDGVDGSQAYNYTDKNCSNLACHNRMATPTTTSAPAERAGNWDAPPVVAATFTFAETDKEGASVARYYRVGCFICHGYYGPPRTSDNTWAPQFTPSDSFAEDWFHRGHAGRTTKRAIDDVATGGIAGDTGMAFGCYQCHMIDTDGVNNNAELFSTIEANTGLYFGHTNGVVDMDFTSISGRTPERLEASAGGANGFFDKDATGNASAGDTGFAPFDGNYSVTCYNIYCHGETLASKPDATRINPVFNQLSSANCGDCHDADYRNDNADDDFFNGLNVGKIQSNGHLMHFGRPPNDPWYDLNPTELELRGPFFGSNDRSGRSNNNAYGYAPPPPYGENYMGGCIYCHYVPDHTWNSCGCHDGTSDLKSGTSNISNVHVDGKVDFFNMSGDPYVPQGTPADKATTTACNNCHSTAVIAGEAKSGAELAKDNWTNASYKLPCLTCHNTVEPAWNYADGVGPKQPPTSRGGFSVPGRRAPAIDANWAVDNGGHGYAGVFSGTGNTGPAYNCDACHDTEAQHFEVVARKETAPFWEYRDPAKRLKEQSAGVPFTADNICDDCHQPGQGAPGVLGFDSSVEATDHSTTINGNFGANPAYDYECVVCHNPHGTSNIAMINETFVDNMGADATNVTLTDERDLDPTAAPDDGVCDRCHGDAVQPHLSTFNPGNHKQGQVCISCHRHKLSFKPLCNDCHTYPGLPGTVTNPNLHRLSPSAHDAHVGIPSDETFTGGRRNLAFFDCSKCHNGSDHNTAGLSDPADWDTVVNTDLHVQVRFDSMNPVAEANNPIDITLDSTSFDDPTNTCSDLFCHSIVQANGGGALTGLPGEYANPVWTSGDPGVECGDCHAGTVHPTPIGEMTSGSHPAHFYNCMTCHGSSTNGCQDLLCHLPGLQHVDAKINLQLTGLVGIPPFNMIGIYDTDSDLLTDEAFGVPGNPYGRCTDVYCHSDGRLTKGGTVTTTNYAVITWGTPHPGCEGCHGGETADALGTYSYGAPDYPNGGTATQDANSHSAHVGSNIPCAACHNATIADTDPLDGWTLLLPKAEHADAGRDIKIADAYDLTPLDKTDDYAVGPKMCSKIICHSGRNVQWGQQDLTPISCSSCHLPGPPYTIMDLDDYTWSNFTGTVALINLTEWNNTGHGETISYASGNPGAAFSGPVSDPNGCAYCHGFLNTLENPRVPHGDATNPFRLTNKGFLARGATEDDGFNDVCLVCHTDPAEIPAAVGYDPDGVDVNYALLVGTRQVNENHYGVRHDAATDGGTFCWDCHDPHGDGQNFMIHSGDGSAPGRGVTRVSDGLYGVPVESGEVTGLDVVTGGYTSDDLVNASFTGLCQTCHAPTGGANYFNQATFTPLTGHNGANATRCTECHSHKNDFAPRCNDCHGIALDGSGRPPTAPTDARGVTPALVWDATVDPDTGIGTGIGNHRSVPTTIPTVDHSSHEPFGCIECHTNTPGSGATHNDGLPNADMDNIAASHGWTGIGGPLAAVWDKGLLDGANDGVGGPGSVNDDMCSNIDCHSPYYNGNAAMSGTPNPYDRYWMNSTQWDCYACHGYNGMITPASGRSMYDLRLVTGSHAPHLVSDPLGISEEGNTFDCLVCHVDNQSVPIPLAHKNGTVNFDFVVSFDPYGTVPVYSQAEQVPTDNDTVSAHRAYGSCSNLYCHSSAQSDPPGAPPTYANPTWGEELPCGGCHGPGRHEPNGMATGSHTPHTRFDCRLCHMVSGCGDCHGRNNRHVDGEINVWLNQTSERDGITVHNGIYDTDNDLLTDEDKGIPGQPYGRCADVYCHGDAKESKSFLLPLIDERDSVYAVITWKTPNPGCEGCHAGTTVNLLGTYQYGAPDYVNEGTATQSANSHSAHVNSGIPCAACHNATITDENPLDGWTLVTGAFVNQVPHVNGRINVVPAPAFDLNGPENPNDINDPNKNYDQTTKTCSFISCHGSSTPQWGQQNLTAVSCDSCHFDPVSDLDDYVWGGFTGTAARINSVEWAAAGHGSAGAYLSGNPGANFSGPVSDPKGCAFCHGFQGTVENPAVGHGDATNPFRLTNKGVLGRGATEDDGWNDVCLVCHTNPLDISEDTGAQLLTATGYDPDGVGTNYVLRVGTKQVNQNHYGAKHDAATDGGNFCWDCHDPHGDAQAFMFHSGNGLTVGQGVTQVSDGLYGVPVTSREVTGLDVVTGGYASDDLVNATFTGVCQTCHTLTNYFNQTTFTPLTSHNGANSIRCTVCHSHKKDFAPRCNDCHGIAADGSGRPPTAPTNARGATPALVWPATVDPDSGLPTGVGNHRTVATTAPTVDFSSHETFGCVECHTATPGSGATHNDGLTNADMPNIAALHGGAWNAGAKAGGAAGGSVTDDYCTNIDCHSSYFENVGLPDDPTNAYVSAGSPSYRRYWLGSDKWDCYTCHGYDNVTGKLPPELKSRTVGYMMEGTNLISSGSHWVHAHGSTDINYQMEYGFPCTYCHVDNVTAPIPLAHKDGVVDFAFTGLPDFYGDGSVYSAAGQTPTDGDTSALHRAYGTCDNVYCHSQVQTEPPGLARPVGFYATPTWGSGADGVLCPDCHNSTITHPVTMFDPTSGQAFSGNHPTHSYNCEMCHIPDTPGNLVNCGHCHFGGSRPHSNGEINMPLDGNDSINGINFSMNGIYDTDSNPLTDEAKGIPGQPYGSCSNVYCHGDGRESKSGTATTTVFAAAIAWDDPNPGCEGCHGVTAVDAIGTYAYGMPDYADGGNATKSANSHAAHAAQNLPCSACHNSITTDSDPAGGWTITATYPHADKKIEMVLANAYDATPTDKTDDYIPAVKGCKNLVPACHGPRLWGFETSASCETCHDGSDVLAPQVVWPAGDRGVAGAHYGAHLKANQTDIINGSTDWKLQCWNCHMGHTPGVGADIPLPPTNWVNDQSGRLTGANMQTRLGIDYNTNGAIHLGGLATNGNTEAEICWNCHYAQAAPVTEFGYNTDTDPSYPVVSIPSLVHGSQASYNFGRLEKFGSSEKVKDWTTSNYDPANWQNILKHGYDATLDRVISSVHSASLVGGQSSSVAQNLNGSNAILPWSNIRVEDKQYIRCSYCHDVHDLNKANAGIGYADNQTGPPYLRGSWLTNPYPPDMPPRNSYTYSDYPTTTGPNHPQGPTNTGSRFNILQTPMPRVWGYNGDDVSRGKGGFFIDENSGNPTADADKNELSETAGLCVLCHAENVDTMDYYTGKTIWRGGTVNGHSNSTIGGTGVNKSDIFDAKRERSSLYMLLADKIAAPVANASAPWYSVLHPTAPNAPRLSGWYGGTAGAIVQQQPEYSEWYGGTQAPTKKAHNFSCSKCHSPHASGLPALLITNCLDVAKSTWSANLGAITAYSQQAGNCHRKTASNLGWHKLLPNQ